MVRRTQLLLFCLLGVVTSLGAQQPPEHNFKPAQGYVPDAVTTIKIAVAVWEPIYGAEQISKQKPFMAVLVNGVWKVQRLPSNTLSVELPKLKSRRTMEKYCVLVMASKPFNRSTKTDAFGPACFRR